MIYTIKQSPSTFQLTYMQHTHQSNTNKIRNTIYIYIQNTIQDNTNTKHITEQNNISQNKTQNNNI